MILLVAATLFVRFWYCVLADHRKLLCVSLYCCYRCAVTLRRASKPHLVTVQWSELWHVNWLQSLCWEIGDKSRSWNKLCLLVHNAAVRRVPGWLHYWLTWASPHNFIAVLVASRESWRLCRATDKSKTRRSSILHCCTTGVEPTADLSQNDTTNVCIPSGTKDFLPCDMHSAAIAVTRCLSVCLSVYHVREMRQNE